MFDPIVLCLDRLKPKLEMLQSTRPTQKRVWLCSTQGSMFWPILLKETCVRLSWTHVSTQIGYVWIVLTHLAMFWTTRPEEKCVRLCSMKTNYDTSHSTQVGYVSTKSTEGKRFILCLTQVSYISTDSKINGYVSTDLTKWKRCSTVFDPLLLCFSRLDSNLDMFRLSRPKEKHLWLCLTQVCYVLTDLTKGKVYSTELDPSLLYFNWLDPI